MGTQRRQFGAVVLEKKCGLLILKDEAKVLRRNKGERVIPAEGKNEQKDRSMKVCGREGTNYAPRLPGHKVG